MGFARTCAVLPSSLHKHPSSVPLLRSLSLLIVALARSRAHSSSSSSSRCNLELPFNSTAKSSAQRSTCGQAELCRGRGREQKEQKEQQAEEAERASVELGVDFEEIVGKGIDGVVWPQLRHLVERASEEEGNEGARATRLSDHVMAGQVSTALNCTWQAMSQLHKSGKVQSLA